MPYTEATAAANASKAHESRRTSSNGVISLMQARLMQDVLNPDTKPSERAMSMRAYVEAEKLKRIIKGQPANTSQSIRHDAKPRVKQSAAPVLETLPEEPVKEP